MKLRIELCSKSKIECWANKYNVDNDASIETLVPEVIERESRYLTKPELIEVSNWVLQRVGEGPREYRVGLIAENNSPDNVEEFTRNAFLSTNDSDSIYCLKNLHRVGPTIASAILHWFHERPYPTWTPHAKWSVNLNPKLRWSSMGWQDYVNYCRTKAEKYQVSMRTLDRAFRECGKANMP